MTDGVTLTYGGLREEGTFPREMLIVVVGENGKETTFPASQLDLGECDVAAETLAAPEAER